MAIGRVKFFNETKGFGFIQPCDGGSDVFVHITAVKSAGMDTLREGDQTSFEVVTERGRPAAAILGSAEHILPRALAGSAVTRVRRAAATTAAPNAESRPSRLEGMLASFLDPLSAESAAMDLLDLHQSDEKKHGLARTQLKHIRRTADLVVRSLIERLIR